MILRDLVTSIEAGAKEGVVSVRNEGDGEGKRGRIVSGTMNRTVKVLFSQPTDVLI